jgi:hypothetical protein
MPVLKPIDAEEDRAMEFMRRYTALIVECANGKVTKVEAEGAMLDIESDTNLTLHGATAILERRLRAN